MNSKYTKRLVESFFFISIIAACMIAVFVGNNFAADNTSVHRDPLQTLSFGWQYEGNAGREEIVSLPTTVKLSAGSESLTMYYQLPDNLPKNSCLEFISQQTSVEAAIDGQLIYTYGVNSNAPVGKLLGNSRNVIILPDDAGGKEIVIRLASPYSPDTYRLSTITLGSRAEILYRFVQSCIGLTVFSLLSVFFCLMVLFLAVFFRVKRVAIDSLSIVLFALFILLSTIWVITDSNILQLLTSNFPLVYFVSHLAFMLFPVPLILFLRQTTRYGHRWYSMLGVMYLVGFSLRIGLFFGGIADLESSLPITHVMMGLGAIIGCVQLAKEWQLYHDKTTFMFLIGFVALGLCLVISLLAFFLGPEPNYSIYFRIMLTVMMVAMLYRIILQLEVMAKKGIEAQVYQELAYIDVLTKLANRLAFEERMQSIQKNPKCDMLTIVVLDINRLKHVNDTYGHSAGDNLIQYAADHIRSTLGRVGKCYRIGGDEFAVILEDFSEQSLKMILQEFQESVAAADPGNPDGLSVSVGYASETEKGDNFAYRLLEKADQAMYVQKEASHQQRKNF